MSGATAYGHTHAEAFMLMRYRCKACGGEEIVWNSRDGVTPFGIDCLACGGGDATHVDWQGDVYAPDHQPELGTRMFVDLTVDRARQSLRAKVEKWPQYAPPAGPERDAFIERGAHAIQPGEPDLVVVAG